MRTYAISLASLRSGAGSNVRDRCLRIRWTSGLPAWMAAGGSNWFRIRATGALPSCVSRIHKGARKAILLISSGPTILAAGLAMATGGVIGRGPDIKHQAAIRRLTIASATNGFEGRAGVG